MNHIVVKFCILVLNVYITVQMHSKTYVLCLIFFFRKEHCKSDECFLQFYFNRNITHKYSCREIIFLNFYLDMPKLTFDYDINNKTGIYV